MIKKNIKNIIIASTLVVSSLSADYSDYAYDGYSLVGVEAGYNTISAEMTDLNGLLPYGSLDGKTYHSGLKIGAQTGHYRVFLNANIHKDVDDEFDYITTYGAEAQYLFTMMPQADFFIGAGIGMANMKFKVDAENFSRTINDPYFLGSVGFNLHLSDGIDFELGGRYMELDATNTKELGESMKEYRFNNIISGYASIIFKYKMD